MEDSLLSKFEKHDPNPESFHHNKLLTLQVYYFH